MHYALGAEGVHFTNNKKKVKLRPIIEVKEKIPAEMDVQKVLHMKEGVGEDSYANNSLLQRNISTTHTKAAIEESVKQVYHALNPKCFMMADMGCSSSANALLIVSETINVVHQACQSLNQHAPEFGIFLNDLPGNDFNTLFNFLPEFYKWVEQEKGTDFGPCFVSGTPRSFYGRVFPDSFLHFIYSGSALHWLSQVPEGLVSDQGVAFNRGSVFLEKTSPPEAHKAYYTQFKKDFSMFLSSRAKEIVPGGSMVLTFPINIRGSTDSVTELLSSIFNDMVSQGMIEEEKLDNVNMPLYFTNPEEVRQLVEEEGSFILNKLETITTDWFTHATQDPDDQAKFFTKFMKATSESLYVKAFGEANVQDFYSRLERKVHEQITTGQFVQQLHYLLVAMTKKT